MSQTVAEIQSTEAQPAGTTRNLPLPITTCVLILVGLVVHLPFAIPQFIWLWNTEHYSFFPLAIVAFGWLVWERLRDHDIIIEESLSTRTVGYFVFNLCLIGLATVAESSWLGWVSFLFFLWTTAHFILGPENRTQIRGVFLVLLLIIPLPLNLDTALVIQLQKIATAQGSLLLDYFGILHGVSGVAVRLPQKLFLIDDACSGIHSLFSALTTMLVYTIYRHYGLVRIAFALIQTVFWVLLANSVRVFLIVYSFNRWDAGLEDGWRHQAVGFVSYVFILMMAISTDQTLRYIFPTREQENESSDRRRKRTPWFSGITKWLNRPFSGRTSSILCSCFLVGFLLSGLTSAARTLGSTKEVHTANFDGKLAFQLTENDLPEQIDGWTRIGFKTVNRDKADVFGANSMIWTYHNNGVEAMFSIDGGYPEFHDLWFCYSSIGWSLRHSENPRLNGDVGDEQNVVATELQLYRGSSEQAHVIYTCVDAQGHVVEPPPPAETFIRNLLNRLRSGSLVDKQQANHLVPPVIQFQAYTHTDTEFFAHERSGIRQLFASLRSVASSKIKAKKESKSITTSQTN
ncbi:MAG: exosortase U [Planctomycetaceae bacterium]|nr:exosortase U [Planctomycetaceae bacterium]